MPDRIILRPLTAQDGAALAGLSYSAADGGIIHYAANYQIDAFQAIQALHGDMEGVAACAPESSRLIGVGLIRFGQCQYEDETYPFAMLGNLIVHPDFRGQGLAAQLVEWQIEKAHQRCGEEMVMVTNFQVGNRISQRIYTRWLEHNARTLLYLPLRTRPDPFPLPGIATRALTEAEYPAFVERHNTFYAPSNFYQPLTKKSLAELCRRSPLPAPIRHVYAALDYAGNPIAGVVVLEEYRLKQMEIRGLPKALELLNNVAGIIPKDGAVREVYLDRLWYLPGQVQAARQLVHAVRAEWAELATNISVLIDPRGLLREVFPTYPWSVVAKTHMLFHGPKEINSDKPICPIF